MWLITLVSCTGENVKPATRIAIANLVIRTLNWVPTLDDEAPACPKGKYV